MICPMVPNQISSLQHPFVKSLVKLREKKEERQARGQVLIAGKKLVSEMAEKGLVETLLISSLQSIPSHWKVKQVVLVNKPILKKISGIEEEEGIAAIVKMPASISLKGMQWILALEGVGDPGNLGTLIRTAHGLGWQGILLLPKCADPFNDKAIRSARGASFSIPLFLGNYEDLVNFSAGLSVFIGDIRGIALEEVSPPSNSFLILGNESHGVSEFCKKRGQMIKISMKNDLESFNVAIAGAILMYKLKN